MQPLRYAVIGTSSITAQYIESARTTGQWTLCAVYSRTPQRGAAFAQQHDIPLVFTDLEAFAQSDAFDAVYVASPNVLHHAHCKILLEHGKHVICEKPFVSYLWQMQELFDLAAQKNLVLVEAMMFAHQPAKKALEEAIAAAGQVQMAMFNVCRRSPQYDRWLAGAYPNVFNPTLHTGALMDMGVYCVWPALWLFGRPESVAAKAVCLPTGTDLFGVVTMQYPDKVVELRYSKASTSATGSEILSAEGRISIGSILHASDIVLHTPDGKQNVVWGGHDKTDLMANEARQFARFITEPENADAQAEYQHCKETSLLASEYLAQIRKDIGLEY